VPAAVQLAGVSAGRDIRIEKIQSIGAVYNIPPATPAFSYRGIAGVPPPTDQSTIQQRTQLVEAIYTKLTQPGINALALTGVGGMGKSTLAALLSQYTEVHQSTGNGFFQAPPLWLSIDQAATFADVIGTIFQQLDKPLSVLDKLSPAGQVEALFTLLDTLALPRLIVLDQVDNLLDWATGKALSTQPGVGEWIDALNSRSWKSNARLLLTSRPFPQGTQVILSPRFQEYAVGGLTPQEGLALLRLRGVQASKADLQTAVTFCDGHPLSLVLLIALIQLYEIPLADLLAEPTLWLGDIATNLLDAVFQHLTEEQRAIVRALSVYRTAVPVAALAPFLMGSSSQQILLSLRPLLVQQVIQPAENGRYQVHAVVARFAQTHFVEGDWQANQQVLRAAHATAAHYYLEQTQATALPREQRRGVNDIQGIIEAVWQYMQAAQWQEAYAVVEQEDLLTDLSFWGGNILLLDLCRSLLSQTEWQPEPEQAIAIYFNLGWAYNNLGNTQQALEALQQALAISREVGDRIMEAATLSSIGDIHADLGNTQQALEALQQALAISREVGDHTEEARTLNNIGKVYYTLGNTQQALEALQQALAILQERGDHVTGGVMLSNMGRVYADLGNTQQALEALQQALAISREVGDRRGEGGTLWTIGILALGQHHNDFALAAFLLARQCFEEISSPWQNEVESWIDDLRRKIGKKRFAALQARVEPQSQQLFEQELRDRQAQHEEEG
jgi:tetratricopeptide (TPR) repeat protein